MIGFEVNGRPVSLEVDPETPLLWVLREDVGLTGTKYGCGVAQCGACTVHLNGEAVRTCVLPVGEVAGRRVTTIEGLGADGLHPVQKLWLEHQVPQCGYCQSGMIMAASALLASNASPSDDDMLAAMTNICRCGTYPRVRAALDQARGRQAQAA
ncbi:(2Fe-2S)-binding protein [Sphingomonas sp. DT-51]|uniref:(2Fe-2S)-binding protein n=1 Tax=Sphingomonas sp. DT-51 TaxID=3396165 RepID=UPI003F1E15D8